MNDPPALTIEEPLGSCPASRTSRLLLVMEVEAKRHWFISAMGMRHNHTKVLMQRTELGVKVRSAQCGALQSTAEMGGQLRDHLSL